MNIQLTKDGKPKKKPGRKPGQKNKPKDPTEQTNIKKKPGRKPGQKNGEKKMLENENNVKIPKKRGRKPKGGKIIKNIDNIKTDYQVKPNIILHLKCNSEITDKTVDNNNFTSYNDKEYLKYTQLTTTTKPNYSLDTDMIENNTDSFFETNEESNNIINKKINKNIITKKIKILNEDLKLIINNKKSSCFWCTYSFENTPFYIPKNKINNKVNVYGCFCSPECCLAYLENENIDNSTKWERISLLNSIYGCIYPDNKSIKPAPNPFYTLEKYYGNLTIEEYRTSLKYDETILIINKPMTHIIPEIYQDNNEFNKTLSYMSKSSKKTEKKSFYSFT